MAATIGAHSARGLDTTRFYFRMAVVFVIIAFAGFTPTYWAPLASGTFSEPPIVHLHGTLLFSWTLLYLMQTALVASGRTARHQAVGLFGIALFSVMCCSIVATRLILLRGEVHAGFGDAARRFSAIALCSLPLLIGLFAAAIANTRRAELHKRLMYLVMVCLMIPAIARVFLVLLKPAGAVGPPPVLVLIPPTLTAALLIVVAIVYERRRYGRVHALYIYGGATLVLWTLAIVPFSGTAAWSATIRALEGLAG
ncbi:MAG TPA: hypothetical protein VLV25_00575 [Steroidobacteraceae bacterium]|nr:hypothetical protein [Steroidobacteraceae bacterium]